MYIMYIILYTLTAATGRADLGISSLCTAAAATDNTRTTTGCGRTHARGRPRLGQYILINKSARRASE